MGVERIATAPPGPSRGLAALRSTAFTAPEPRAQTHASFGSWAADRLVRRRRRGAINRLAVALQIGFVKMTGAPLNSVQLLPVEVLDHLGRQLGAGDGTPRIASMRALYRRPRKAERVS